MMKFRLVVVVTILLSGCSIFGYSEVEIAPYTVLKVDAQQAIEVRRYEPMILVSTPMANNDRNGAFRRLFRYISGENKGTTTIAMTAPVLMAEQSPASGAKIAMTAPVFMSGSNKQARMAFVMPKEFTVESTPEPIDPAVQVEALRDYTVAAIRFNGTLSRRNIAHYSQQLQSWISTNGYVVVGEPVEAGYNGPLTLPMFRRNEILIEISVR